MLFKDTITSRAKLTALAAQYYPTSEHMQKQYIAQRSYLEKSGKHVLFSTSPVKLR